MMRGSRGASLLCAGPAISSPRSRTEAPMKRLYHQIYLTTIASLVVVVASAGALWRFGPAEGPAAQAFELAGELVAGRLPPPAAEPDAQQRAVDALHEQFGLDLALLDRDRRQIAA